MSNQNKKLIVVLGMHRSGTSVTTRGLQVMGVSLGEKTMPPAKGNNDKGFWEDLDLNSFNIEILKVIENDWYYLAPIRRRHIKKLRSEGYVLRASELLHQKTSSTPVFGFKDPRVVKLLSFWKEVFSDCQFDVNYVLTLRHPLSVVKSLTARNGFIAEHSYLLWLGHVLESLSGSAGSKRVLVDYDRLLKSPDVEMMRISKSIGLEIDRAALQSYKAEFLEEALRHTVYDSNDLLLDNACLPIVREVYTALLDVASDKVTLDDKALQSKVSEWLVEYERLKSSLLLVDKLFSKETAALNSFDARLLATKVDYDKQIQHRDDLINQLEKRIEARDSQLLTLEQGIEARDGQIITLEQGIEARDGKIITLEQGIEARDRQILTLEQGIEARDGQIITLEQGIEARDGKIITLEQGIEARDTQIATLEQGLKQRDTEIRALGQGLKERDAQIKEVLSSNSWKITSPLRTFRRMCDILPSILFRRYPSKMLRLIWRKLPANEDQKQLIKRSLFKLFPAFFARSQAYRDWHELEQKRKIDQSFEHVAHMPINSPSVRIITFYLPQFHPIPENDDWWGKGFTEWSNVKPAQPQFPGHYQPKLPGDLGYYDLRDTSIQQRQIDLAKNYGVSGFSFYFYWFKGKRLLETPLLNYLNDTSLDLPFCLCWANENWSRRWDGLDSEMLITQEHSPSDDLEFIKYISSYLNDPRYIKIEGKPLLLVYRPSLLPSPVQTAKRWRKWCRDNGVGEIYLAYTQSFESVNPRKYGFDAAIEFPPNNSEPPIVTDQIEGLGKDFEGVVYDWSVFLERSQNYKRPGYKLFRSVTPSWDNTARRKSKGTIFVNSSPEGYQIWLSRAINDTLASFKKQDERLVFVNAWNEWAEGAYLEPDQLYGYAYLNATRAALETTSSARKIIDKRTGDKLAVVIHCFYLDVFEELLGKLAEIPLAAKIYVTTLESYEEPVSRLLNDRCFEYMILTVDNKGRDILPFLHIMPHVIDGGHEVVLKLHTKKSKHRQDGDVWRSDLFNKLLNPSSMKKIMKEFKDNSDLGMVGPDGHIVSMESHWGSNEEAIIRLAWRMGLSVRSVLWTPFVAGSMFYCRTSTLSELLNLGLNDNDFEEESGQLDGTLAHAIERLFSVCLVAENKRLLSTTFSDASQVPAIEQYKHTGR